MWNWLKGSPPKSKQLVAAEQLFSAEELNALTAHFRQAAARASHTHAGQASGKEAALSKEPFLSILCGLPLSHPVAAALFNAVRQGASDIVVLADVVVAKARIERMGEEEATQFCYALLHAVSTAGPGPGSDPADADAGIDQAGLERGLAACSSLALGQAPAPQLLAAAAAGALAHGGADGGGGAFTLAAYRRWAKAWPACHCLLASLLQGVGQGQGPAPPASTSTSTGAGAPGWMPVLPALLQLGRTSPGDLLLQPLWSWMLSSCMAPELRQEWRCLFNSQRDGKSFNTLMGRLGGCQRPSLLLIRDKAGHTFGGFAPAPWVKAGAFFGDASTFVFGLTPVTQIFRATGANKNFQWCGVGFSQLPNGIGFGGPEKATHAGHFAVYVDSSCDQGVSRPISTFGTVASLASEQVFQVAVVECWQLQANEEEEGAAGGVSSSKSSSVLDRMAQDRVVMGMAGFAVNNSAGLRAEPIEGDEG